MSDSQIPIARREGLVIQELPDEILVYDLETNRAHCLNRTAAAIWKSCDGNNSIDAIARRLAETNGGPVQNDLIRLAIDQLNESNLLENKAAVNFNPQNRREVVRKIGLAAVVALPLVTSLVAPKAAQAGSVCNAGSTCACNPVNGVTPASCTPANASGCNANCSSCAGAVGNQVCA